MAYNLPCALKAAVGIGKQTALARVVRGTEARLDSADEQQGGLLDDAFRTTGPVWPHGGDGGPGQSGHREPAKQGFALAVEASARLTRPGGMSAAV